MKIIGLLKYLIFALIILSIFAVVFEAEIISNVLLISIPLVIFVWYYKESDRLDYRIIFIFLSMYLGSVVGAYMTQNGLLIQIISYNIAYSTLLYFSYQNNKFFGYSRRDIFTIVMGSSLYTLIFIITLYELYGIMGVFTVPIIVMILLLYVLLIAAGMHYVNIRSEQSMWFFLVILSFVISDISLILDVFYVPANELQVLKTIYHPLALFFLIKYITSDATILKSDSLENF